MPVDYIREKHHQREYLAALFRGNTASSSRIGRMTMVSPEVFASLVFWPEILGFGPSLSEAQRRAGWPPRTTVTCTETTGSAGPG
jgi:hypothetical protein